MRDLRLYGCALVILAAAPACSTEVTNPGPVQDRFLESRDAATALVNGSGRALASGLNWISYTGAAVTREIHPAGSTGSFGISSRWQVGELNANDGDLDSHYEQSQRARWLAEEAVRRLEAVGPPTPGVDIQTPVAYANALQAAYVYAGFANRVLGENLCTGTIDGGPEVPGATFFTRADSLFTKAIAVTGGTAATMLAQRTAAYAGRASARMHLGSWAAAISDAAQVPIAFVYNLPYFNLGEDAQRNRIAWASANTPYRAHTQWSTWHYEYRLGATPTVDPRISISVTTLQGDAAIDCCGRVPFHPQTKHANSAAPIRLASGREMRLIEAENELRAGNMGPAMTLINTVRTNAGAPTVTATDITDAWRLLKRERGIELWLEARRMGDLRRWAAASTPGALHPLEMVGATTSHLTRQDLCFPISKSERETNINF